MKTFILFALFAYAYAVELQHVPKIKVTQVVQHVPQVGNDKVPQVGGDKVVLVDKVEIPVADHQIPKRVQKIIDNVHQHIPQVINHHVSKQKGSQVVAGQQVQQQVPNVVDGKVSPVAAAVGQAAQVAGNKAQVPHHIQQVVDNVHQHIPQVINQHVTSQKVPQVQPVVGKN